MASYEPISQFDVTKTIIKFDARYSTSVSVTDFRPEMLENPSSGTRSRSCSIEATFVEFDRAKGLRMANAEARELTAKKSGMWTQATVGSTPEDFDTARGRRSVTVAQFHPTMLGKPAWGETDRRYPFIEIFESPDRAKALHDANSKAEQLLQDIVKSYEADFPHFSESTEGVKEDGMIWRVAMSIFGRQRCEIQIKEQPSQEIPSSPRCPAIGMNAESFNQMKARTDALLAAFDPWLNLEHHEWPPLPESSMNEEP
ncbi:MAG: hypothetical protein Q9203_003107 [Teloschistes exilis]